LAAREDRRRFPAPSLLAARRLVRHTVRHDRERLKLLFGPCKAPRLKRGDRATGLFRDRLVVITG
jgi:hypothetical protein